MESVLCCWLSMQIHSSLIVTGASEGRSVRCCTRVGVFTERVSAPAEVVDRGFLPTRSLASEPQDEPQTDSWTDSRTARRSNCMPVPSPLASSHPRPTRPGTVVQAAVAAHLRRHRGAHLVCRRPAASDSSLTSI